MMKNILDGKKWAQEEENIVWEEIQKHYPRTHTAFRAATERLGRSFRSIESHFYKKMKIEFRKKLKEAGEVTEHNNPTWLAVFIGHQLGEDALEEVRKLKEHLENIKDTAGTRIASLEAENSRLKARISELEAENSHAKAKLVDVKKKLDLINASMLTVKQLLDLDAGVQVQSQKEVS